MENLEKVHWVIDEMIINGHIVETNKILALAAAQTIDKASRWACFFEKKFVEWTKEPVFALEHQFFDKERASGTMKQEERKK